MVGDVLLDFFLWVSECRQMFGFIRNVVIYIIFEGIFYGVGGKVGSEMKLKQFFNKKWDLLINLYITLYSTFMRFTVF